MDRDLELLQCPATGKPLRRDGNRLVAGSRTYPIIAGVPVLIASDRSIFTAENYVEPSPAQQPSLVRRIDRRIPGLTYNEGGPRNIERVAELLTAGTARKRVLLVGGGNAGSLVKHPSIDVTNTDVFIGAGTDIVCDGHDLPFRDETFDAVIVIAVLEHVLDPARVVSEIHRVLKPSGIVYSEIPFLQRVHAGAHDFTRFTLLGHRRLFRYFDTVRLEAPAGPGSSVAWALDGLMLALIGRNRPLWLLANRLSRLVFFWLPRLDRWLVRTPAGQDSACGTAFLGTKRNAPVSDREIIAEYSGACPTQALP